MRKITIFLLFVFKMCNGALHNSVEETATMNTRLLNAIDQTAECIRQHLKNGYEGIPSFDPLVIDHLDLVEAINSSYIRGEFGLNDLEIDGIPSFVVTNVTLLGLWSMTLEMLIEVERVVATADYLADSQLFDFLNIYGKGDIMLEFSNIGIQVRIESTLIGPSTSSVFLTVSDVDVSISGLLNQENMSRIISNTLQRIILQFLDEFGEEIDSQISGILQSYLGDYGFLQLLVVLSEIAATCQE